LRRTRTRIKSIISNGICENLRFRRLCTRQMPNLHIHFFFLFLHIYIYVLLYTIKITDSYICCRLISSCLSNCDYVTQLTCFHIYAIVCFGFRGLVTSYNTKHWQRTHIHIYNVLEYKSFGISITHMHSIYLGFQEMNQNLACLEKKFIRL
jgi:hypothetical protein